MSKLIKVRKYLLNFYSKTTGDILVLTYDNKEERDRDLAVLDPVSTVNIEIDYLVNDQGELIIVDEHSGIYQFGAKYEKNRTLSVVKTSSNSKEEQDRG